MADGTRISLKTVDAALMATGVYFAKFTSGAEFKADIRTVPGLEPGAMWDGFDSLPPMAQRTLCYGLKQKLDDSMAGVDNEEEAIEELKSTWEAILKGNWTSRVPGEGVEGGLFARAYAERHQISLADAKSKISGLVEKNLKANQERNPNPKKGEEITEKMVFNRIRDVALERDTELAKIYEALKAKKKQKKR